MDHSQKSFKCQLVTTRWQQAQTHPTSRLSVHKVITVLQAAMLQFHARPASSALTSLVRTLIVAVHAQLELTVIKLAHTYQFLVQLAISALKVLTKRRHAPEVPTTVLRACMIREVAQAVQLVITVPSWARFLMTRSTTCVMQDTTALKGQADQNLMIRRRDLVAQQVATVRRVVQRL